MFSQNLRRISIELNYDDTILLHNLLNEVCHGIRICDFEKKIGCKKGFLRRFFSKYHQFAKAFFALHPL